MNKFAPAILVVMLGSGCVHARFQENQETIATEKQCSCIPDNRNGVWETLGSPPCWVKQMGFYPIMADVQLGLHVLQTRTEAEQKKYFCKGGRRALIYPRDGNWHYDYALERRLIQIGNVWKQAEHIGKVISLNAEKTFCGKRVDRWEKIKLIAYANSFGRIQSPGGYRFKK